MKLHQVKLPRGNSILLFIFTRAIAEARCPIKNLKGIECITGLVALPGTLPGITVSMPILLKDSDKAKIEALLPHLPRLEYPIEPSVAKSFLEAYRKHQNRLIGYEPKLITSEWIERRKSEQSKIIDEHRKSILTMWELGEIELLDENYVPMRKQCMDMYIARQDAIDYLKKCRLIVEEEFSQPSNAVDNIPSKVGVPQAEEDIQINDTDRKIIHRELSKKGGITKAQRNVPLKEFIQKLFVELRPPEKGWKSRAQAVSIIKTALDKNEDVKKRLNSCLNEAAKKATLSKDVDKFSKNATEKTINKWLAEMEKTGKIPLFSSKNRRHPPCR
ncbi:MAG: hypothetical protein LBI68_02405 [Azoarcus sp.]|jgi:hypothetical protein|nr:hypothetical protein [Azoarcus sp.]